MDRDKLIQRLRATFLVELREHVESFNRELLSLERDTNAATRAESIKTLFRVAHSLKGAARAVSASKLEVVCHKLEELLSGLRDGTRELTPEVFETLFAAVDSFEEAGRMFGAPETPAASPPPKAAEEPSPAPEPPARASLPPPAASVVRQPAERVSPPSPAATAAA
ncbi:MAG TPA: Hpt domain-containing protein, partial [Polyangiales bacterium]|nr:Hpt domain-containing protein [Polyangiales bacterium]